jgi:hypothetical protein
MRRVTSTEYRYTISGHRYQIGTLEDLPPWHVQPPLFPTDGVGTSSSCNVPLLVGTSSDGARGIAYCTTCGIGSGPRLVVHESCTLHDEQGRSGCVLPDGGDGGRASHMTDRQHCPVLPSVSVLSHVRPSAATTKHHFEFSCGYRGVSTILVCERCLEIFLCSVKRRATQRRRGERLGLNLLIGFRSYRVKGSFERQY